MRFSRATATDLHRLRRNPAQATPNGKKKIIKKGIAQKVVTPKKTANSKVTKNKPKSSPTVKPKFKAAERRSSSLSEVTIPVRRKDDKAVEDEASEDDDSNGPSYWLMKAEPESRIEKGKDVKFSIDDLKTATEPEAWMVGLIFQRSSLEYRKLIQECRRAQRNRSEDLRTRTLSEWIADLHFSAQQHACDDAG